MENNRKLCPYCGESIAQTARKCRFCGEWLPGCSPQDVSEPNQAPVTETPIVTTPATSPAIPAPTVTVEASETIEYEYPIERKYYSGALLTTLLIIGGISALIDMIPFLSPELYEDLLYNDFNITAISTILTAIVEITLFSLMYQKFKAEDVTKPARVWIMVGIIGSVASLLGNFMMDDYDPSALAVLFVVFGFISYLVVAGMFFTNPETRRIGIMTFVALVCAIVAFCLIDDNPHHDKGYRKLVSLLYAGGYIAMYDAYKRYLGAPEESLELPELPESEE